MESKEVEAEEGRPNAAKLQAGHHRHHRPHTFSAAEAEEAEKEDEDPSSDPFYKRYYRKLRGSATANAPSNAYKLLLTVMQIVLVVGFLM
jgi:hypothetical protein